MIVNCLFFTLLWGFNADMYKSVRSTGYTRFLHFYIASHPCLLEIRPPTTKWWLWSVFLRYFSDDILYSVVIKAIGNP